MGFQPYGGFKGADAVRNKFKDLYVDTLWLSRELLLMDKAVIRSTNYTAGGTSGFQLSYDGSAVFNDVTLYGTFATGVYSDVENEFIVIGENGYASYVKFYADVVEQTTPASVYSLMKGSQVPGAFQNQLYITTGTLDASENPTVGYTYLDMLTGRGNGAGTNSEEFKLSTERTGGTYSTYIRGTRSNFYLYGNDSSGSAEVRGDITNSVLYFFTGGSERLQLDSARAEFSSTQVLVANGVVGTPSLGFTTETSTGLYYISSGRIGFTGAGTHIAEFNNGKLRSAASATGSPEILFGTSTGSTSAPVYSFQGDTQLGMYRVGAGIGALVASNTWNTGWTSQGLYLKDGSSSTPSLYFYNDTDAGMYHDGTRVVFAEAGTGVFSYKASEGLIIYGSDPYTTKHAWLTLYPPSTGGNYDDGSAGITIGESGKMGAAAMHLIYTGDGYGRIGTGTVTLGAAATMPTYTRMSMVYNGLTWYQEWSTLYVSNIYYNATAYGVVRVSTGGAGTAARVSQNSYSSKREYKRDIKTHSVENSPFLKYRPVTYRYRNHPDLAFIDQLNKREKKYGFILEEVKEAGVAEKRIEKHPHTGEDHGLFYDSWIEELVTDHTALVKDHLELKAQVQRLLTIIEQRGIL